MPTMLKFYMCGLLQYMYSSLRRLKVCTLALFSGTFLQGKSEFWRNPIEVANKYAKRLDQYDRSRRLL